jgi:hypothetical protein
MSNTKRETSLSHQDGYTCSSFFGKECDCDACIYEVARAKDAQLIQRLVDDLRLLRIEFGNRVGQTTQIGIASLSAAEAAGFKPSIPSN